MHKYCWVDGRIKLGRQAMVAVNDLAVLRGYAVFDFLKTVNGRPLWWREHWRRFQNSARLLGLQPPRGGRAASLAVVALMRKNRVKDASVRLLLTGGETSDGVSLGRPRFFILLEDLYTYPTQLYTQGAKVITYEHARIIPEAKSTNYLTAIRLQREKKKAGAIEILYVSAGQVLECATSNFFLVKSGVLVTPRSAVLPGITRGAVLKLAAQAGIKVEEREIGVGELQTADEAFLTSTNRDVMPIVRIGSLPVGSGLVGPVTQRLVALYAERLAQN